MQLLWAILVLFSLSNIVHGQTPSEAEPTVEELLIQANSKKTLAAREIAQLPNRVEDEVDRLTSKLDSLFQNQIQERFGTHYEQIEQSLQTVVLPENVGTLDVALKQYKALADPSDLNTLVKDFVLDAQITLESEHEKWAKYINIQLDETLTADELKRTQDTVREPFQEILRQHFPVWDVPDLHAPPFPVLPGVQEKDRSDLLNPALGLTGILLIALHRRIFTIVRRKIAGKVLGKLIPLAGPLLLGLEVWDVSQAKANLENELRTQILSTYQEEFSPTAIRQQLQQQVSTSLEAWSEHCRREVEQILEAAHVFDRSPNVQDYIAEQTENGSNTQEIIEDMHRVGKAFKEGIIADVPLRHLLVIVQASDKGVVDIVSRAYQKNPEAVQAFLSQWPVKIWERYREPDQLDALLGVAAYRLTEQNRPAPAFASEIRERNDLIRIFSDVGLCGVQIWDTYVGSAAGQHQRQMAKDAIDLYKEGYPCEVLQTQEGLAKVQLYQVLPFGFGLQAFHMLRPLGIIAYWGGIFLMLLLVAVPAVWLLRKLGKRDAARRQQTKDGGTGGASQLPPSTLEPKPLPVPSSSPTQSLPPPNEPEPQ